MIASIASQWIEFADQYVWLAWTIFVCLHVTIVVATGYVIAKALSRHSAAASHLAWVGVMIAVALLAPAKLLIPSFKISVEDPPPVIMAVVAMRETPHDPSDTSIEVRRPVESSDSFSASLAPQYPAPFASSRFVAEKSNSTSPLESNSVSPLHWQAWIGILYGIGVLFSLSRVVVGSIRLRRYAREGQTLSAECIRLRNACATRIGLRKVPSCWLSESVSVPLTFGSLCPRILLPACFESWSMSQQRDCLLHEMSHIVRRDSTCSWLSCVATSLYWFHPAVHFAAKNLQRTREDATDDLVLAMGVESSEYATSLLEVTAQSRHRSLAPSVAMASILPIEGRLRRILDTTTRRRPSSWWLGVAIGGVFIVLGCFGVRLSKVVAQAPVVEVQQETSPASKVIAVSSSSEIKSTFFESLSAAPLAKGDDNGIVLSVRGVIRDPQRNPVDGAVVVLRELSTNRFTITRAADRKTVGGSHVVDDVFARTVSAEDGSFEFRNIQSPAIGEKFRNRWDFDVVSAVETGPVGWTHISLREIQAASAEFLVRDVDLRKTASVSGRVLDIDGKPVSSVIARLSTIDPIYAESSYLLDDPNKFDLNASSMQLAVVTDAEGRFRFPALPFDVAGYVFIADSSHSFGTVRVTPSKLDPARNLASEPIQGSSLNSAPVLSNPVEIRAVPVITLHGTLMSDDGTPIPNFEVRLSSSSIVDMSDSEGKFTLSTTAEVMRQLAESVQGIDMIRIYAFAAKEAFASNKYVRVSTRFNLDKLFETETVNLVTNKGVPLRGKVIARDDKSPVVGATIALRRTDDTAGNSVQLSGTDELGEFRLVAPKGQVQIGVFGQLPGYDLPRWSSLDNDYSDQTPLNRMLDLSGDEPHEIEAFEVERGGSLLIKVVDDNDDPVSAALVTATHAEPFGIANRAGRATSKVERELAKSAPTNRDGEVTLNPMKRDFEDGQVRAEKQIDGASWFGHAYVPKDSSEPILVKLKPAWKISGRVTVDGEPATNVAVTISRLVIRNPKPGSFTFGLSTIAGSATTDVNGEYTFSVTADEPYSVRVRESPIDGATFGTGYFPKPISDTELKVDDIEFVTPDGKVE